MINTKLEKAIKDKIILPLIAFFRQFSFYWVTGKACINIIKF